MAGEVLPPASPGGMTPLKRAQDKMALNQGLMEKNLELKYQMIEVRLDQFAMMVAENQEESNVKIVNRCMETAKEIIEIDPTLNVDIEITGGFGE